MVFKKSKDRIAALLKILFWTISFYPTIPVFTFQEENVHFSKRVRCEKQMSQCVLYTYYTMYTEKEIILVANSIVTRSELFHSLCFSSPVLHFHVSLSSCSFHWTWKVSSKITITARTIVEKSSIYFSHRYYKQNNIFFINNNALKRRIFGKCIWNYFIPI